MAHCFEEGALVEVDYPQPGALQIPRWRLGVVRRVSGRAVLVEGSHAGLLRLSPSSPRLAPAFTHTVWCGDAKLIARSAIPPGAAMEESRAKGKGTGTGKGGGGGGGGGGFLRLGSVVMTAFRTADGAAALGCVEVREQHGGCDGSGRWSRALVRGCDAARRRLRLQWCESVLGARSGGGGGGNGGGGGGGSSSSSPRHPEHTAGAPFWLDVDAAAKSGRLAHGRHYDSYAVARWGLAHPFLPSVCPPRRPWVRPDGRGAWLQGDVVEWDDRRGCESIGATAPAKTAAASTAAVAAAAAAGGGGAATRTAATAAAGGVGGGKGVQCAMGGAGDVLADTAASLQVRVRFRTATGPASRWFSVLDPSELAVVKPPPGAAPSRGAARQKAASSAAGARASAAAAAATAAAAAAAAPAGSRTATTHNLVVLACVVLIALLVLLPLPDTVELSQAIGLPAQIYAHVRGWAKRALLGSDSGL